MKKSNHNKSNEFSIIKRKEMYRNFYNDKGYNQFVNYSYGFIIKTFTCTSRKELRNIRNVYKKYYKTWLDRDKKRGVNYY